MRDRLWGRRDVRAECRSMAIVQYVDRVVEGVPLYVGGCHSLASLHTLISTKYRRGKQQCKDGECNKRELRRGK